MPKIGFALSRIAEYHYDPDRNVESYSGYRPFARTTERNYEPEEAEAEEFWADDSEQETLAGDETGKITHTVGELWEPTEEMLTGAKTVQRVVNGETVTEVIFDEDRQSKKYGYGDVVIVMYRGVKYYKAQVWRVVQYSIPKEAVKTKEKGKIEWQTDQIEGNCTQAKTGSKVVRSFIRTTSIETAIAYLDLILNEGKPYVQPEAPAAYPDGTPSSAWTKNELLAYATAHGVTGVGPESSKDEILAALTA